MLICVVFPISHDAHIRRFKDMGSDLDSRVFGRLFKGPSVTTKVSPEVVPEVRKCAETGLKPP